MKREIRIFVYLLIFTFIIGSSGCATGEEKNAESIVSAESTSKIETEIDKEVIMEETGEAPITYAAAVKGEYSGWLCGMLPSLENEANSDVLVLNSESGEVKKITTLEQISSTQTCAVSPDGNWVAYTEWVSEDHTEGVCLVVRNMISGEEKLYLQNNGCDPLLMYMIWLPDNHSLLLNMSLKNQQYYTDMLGVLDVKTEEMRILDQGGVWQGKKTIDYDMDWTIPLTTQEELDALIKRYGGRESIPVEENGSYNYVEFGAPVLSLDQRTAIYSVNFKRNSASWTEGEEEMARLTLASGIFQVDLENGNAKLIYANSVQKSCMGNVKWLNENMVVFDRYYNEMSRGDCEVVSTNLDTGEEKIISPRKEGKTAQKVRGINNGYIGVSVDGEEGEKFVQLDENGQEKEEIDFSYGGKKISLWRFYEIP